MHDDKWSDIMSDYTIANTTCSSCGDRMNPDNDAGCCEFCGEWFCCECHNDTDNGSICLVCAEEHTEEELA